MSKRGRLFQVLVPMLLVGILFVLPSTAQAAQQWLAPVTLSDPTQDASEPQVGVDSQGNAVALWTRFDGTNLRVQSASRPAGGAFGAAATLSAAGADASEPQVAVDPAGNAVAVWSRNDGTNLRIQTAFRPAGGSFGAVTTLSAAGQSAFDPQVSIDSTGRAVAVWVRFDGTNFRIQSATRPSGGSFGSVQTVSATGADAFEPQVDLAPDGNGAAVWYRSDGTRLRVQAATKTPTGSFGAAQTISPSTEDAFSPQVAVSSPGNATAVWYASDGVAKLRVESASRPSGGSFGAVQTLSDTTQDAFEPQVDVDPSGNAVAVWTRHDGSVASPACCNRIQAAVRPSGGSFGSAQTISAAGRDATKPQVDLDPIGDATAVWYRSDGTHTRIETAARPSGGSFGAVKTISDPGQNNFDPQVDASDSNAVAVWYRNGAKFHVQAAVREERYDHPRLASRLTASLVPAFRPTLSATQCTSRGGLASTHGAPLALTSCNPPAFSPGTQAFFGSSTEGFVQYIVLRGDGEPGNGVDADIVILGSMNDIETASGTDYNPSLSRDVSLATNLRVTDAANNTPGQNCAPASCQATLVDFELAAPINCIGNIDAGVGSTCNVNTSVNGLMPGAVEDASGMSIQVARIRVKDAGPNAVSGDSDDRLFAIQGFYIP